MNKEIERVVEQASALGTGLLGLSYLDLSNGETCSINGDVLFPIASVYKVFILCELSRQLKMRKLSLSDRIILQEADKVNGSGMLKNEKEGNEYSLRQYRDWMMQISDNTASDYLLKLIRPENVDRYIIRPTGLVKTHLDLSCREMIQRYYSISSGRIIDPVSGHERGNFRLNPYFACKAEKNNVTTPKEMQELMRCLYFGLVIDGETDRSILEVMTGCENNLRIPAGLPKGTRVAHKSGSLDHVGNDVGIVYTPDGDYVLSLFYNGNVATEEEYLTSSWSQKATAVLSEISREIYRARCGR